MLVRESKEELATLLGERVRRSSRRRIESFYPSTGPLRRELYPKHLAFFKAGKDWPERCICAANRIGKTEGIGGYEVSLHLTGLYPDWWEGRRFRKATKIWAAGNTNQTTRDIVQKKLVGEMNKIGTGMIPGNSIIEFKRKASSVPDTIETVYVRHVSGGVSILGFKSYEQGRKAFEGTEQDVILLDEEPPIGVYGECLIRTMDVSGGRDGGGIILLTFTPLQGVTETVLSFMPGGLVGDPKEVGKWAIQATWNDAPHITEADKVRILQSTPIRQRDARSKGIPVVGSGLIYPIGEEAVKVPDFEIPAHWPRAFSLDVGWNWTAVLWGAWDRDSGVTYLYSEYKTGEELPLIHVEAIKTRGEWIRGVDDPSALQSSQRDGEKLHDEYVKLGLSLTPADNAVEAGIFSVWMALSLGKLKVFESLVKWAEEFRLYSRDEKGKVVKRDDHLMDTMRYLVRSGKGVAKVMPVDDYKIRMLEKIGAFGSVDKSVLFFGLRDSSQN